MNNKRMEIPILEQNAIIKNGKVYILIDDTMPEECSRCELYEDCYDDSDSMLCTILSENCGHVRFQCIGDLIEMKVKI